MKILKANNPKPGTTPIVVALSDLSNAKLRDNFNYDTMMELCKDIKLI